MNQFWGSIFYQIMRAFFIRKVKGHKTGSFKEDSNSVHIETGFIVNLRHLVPRNSFVTFWEGMVPRILWDASQFSPEWDFLGTFSKFMINEFLKTHNIRQRSENLSVGALFSYSKNITVIKGQLISKCLCGVIVSTKKPKNFF